MTVMLNNLLKNIGPYYLIDLHGTNSSRWLKVVIDFILFPLKVTYTFKLARKTMSQKSVMTLSWEFLARLRSLDWFLNNTVAV